MTEEMKSTEGSITKKVAKNFKNNPFAKKYEAKLKGAKAKAMAKACK